MRKGVSEIIDGGNPEARTFFFIFGLDKGIRQAALPLRHTLRAPHCIAARSGRARPCLDSAGQPHMIFYDSTPTFSTFDESFLSRPRSLLEQWRHLSTLIHMSAPLWARTGQQQCSSRCMGHSILSANIHAVATPQQGNFCHGIHPTKATIIPT